MIEGEVQPVHLPDGDDQRVRSVVARPWSPLGPGAEHGGDGVKARIAGRIRVGVKLLDVQQLETCLFHSFPAHRGFQALPVVDEPTREGEAHRRVRALDQHDPPGDLDDDVHRHEGSPEQHLQKMPEVPARRF